MLGDNIRILRKEKGFTQETFAQQLNVVRQTVSKWEKGASVPDAEMLNSISEVLEVPVSTILGSTIPEPEKEKKESEQGQGLEEIAKQLAILNTQLANKASRRKKILKWILLGLLAFIVLYFLCVILFMTNLDSKREMSMTTLVCELDGETYTYEMTHDQNFQIYEAGGDSYIIDTVLAGKNYNDAHVLTAQVELFFKDRGGTVTITEKTLPPQ